MATYKFGHEFQQEIIFCCLNIGGFLDRVRGALEHELFGDPIHSFLVDLTLRHFDSMGSVPSRGALMEGIRKEANDNSSIFSITACRKELRAINKLTNVDHEFVASKVKSFAAETKARELVSVMDDFFDAEEYEQWFKQMEEALSIRLPEPTLTPYGEGIEERFKSYRGGYHKAGPVRTGVMQLDYLLGGGPGKGELAVLMGLTNSGKSHFIIHFGATAVESGLKVHHFTLEMSRQELLRRYDKRLTRMQVKDLAKRYRKASKKVKDYALSVSAYEAGCLKPGELRNAIKRAGVPDLLIVDYPALMWSGSVSDPRFTRFAVEANYLACRNLAQEFGFAVWAPFQVNRAGHETQKSEGDFIGMENAAEAYGVNRHADINISWNQTPEEFDAMRGRLVIIKNRSGPVREQVRVVVDWGKGTNSQSYVEEA